MKSRSNKRLQVMGFKPRFFLFAAFVFLMTSMALVPQGTEASSFQILEQSPAMLGKSFAGTASDVNDATTIFFNPAGMSQLDGLNFTLGGNGILPVSEFDDSGSNTGGTRGETDELGFVPNLYYTYPINDRFTFGLGVNAPFGLESSYDKDWIGRYLATDSELTVINVNPVVSYQVSPTFSVGFGLAYQDIDAELENQVDSTFGVSPNPATDSSVKIEGDDDDIVADLSLYWQATSATTLGVLWRQGGDFTLDGNADFTFNPLACGVGSACRTGLSALEGAITADLELPDTINLSGSHVLNPLWTVHADVAWTEWSTIDTVQIVNDNGAQVDELVLEYDDTFRYSLGASYTPSGPWTWRFGVAFDEAPQTAPNRVTARIPDEDRTWISFGFNYAYSSNASIDFGYAHLFVSDAEINRTNTFASTGASNTVRGEFDNSVDIFGLQGNWQF